MNVRRLTAPFILVVALGACKRSQPQPPLPPRVPPSANPPAVPPVPTPPGTPTAPTTQPPQNPPEPPPTPLPVPAAATPTVNATPARGLTLTLGATAGTVYRDASGNWIQRAYVVVKNVGTEPVDVSVDHFRAGDLTSCGEDQRNFPGHTSLIPNMTIQGDVAFWIDGTQPQPRSLAITYDPLPPDSPAAHLAPWTATVPLTFSPAPPVHGYAPATVAFALGVTVLQPIHSWVTDSRKVRLRLRIHNPTSVPIMVPRSYLQVAFGDLHSNGVDDSQCSLPDPFPIPAGGDVEGGLAVYFDGTPALPANAQVTFGPPNNPQFTQTVHPEQIAPPVQ